MAITNEQYLPIQLGGAFTTQQKLQLRETLNNLPAASITPVAAPTALTNNTGGTPNDTLVAITVTTPADLAAQATINTQIRDNITDLATKVNQIRAALISAGILS